MISILRVFYLFQIFIFFAVTLATILAEPPVNNRYLPPQQGFNGGSFSAPSQNYGPPSQDYGPPNGGSGFGGQRQTDAVFRSRPSSTYGAPGLGRNSNRPSSQYGPPSQSSPSSQYGLPSPQLRSSQFGSPQLSSSQFGSQLGSQFGSAQPSSRYGPPSFGSQGRQGFGSASSARPNTQYGAPDLSAPSQQYGAPGFGSAGAQYSGASNGFGNEQSRAYLPPGRGGYAGDDGSNGEPANYSFEYMVKDDASGNDFGHRESRQGDRAEGVYYVLLPDGRKQTVEYEADENGYKPRISYEDVGSDLGGYSGNDRGGYQNGGYQNGGYQNGGSQNGGYQNGGSQNGGYQNGGPY